jgi:hypothetical protein
MLELQAPATIPGSIVLVCQGMTSLLALYITLFSESLIHGAFVEKLSRGKASARWSQTAIACRVFCSMN